MDQQMSQQQRDEVDMAFRTQVRTEKAWTLFVTLIATGSSPGEAMRKTEDAIRVWIGYEEEHTVRIPFLGAGNVFYPTPPGLGDVDMPNPNLHPLPPTANNMQPEAAEQPDPAQTVALATGRIVRVMDQSTPVPTSPRVFNPGMGTVSGGMYGSLLWPVTMEKDNGAASYPVALCWDLASAQRVSDALNDAKANGHPLNLSRFGKQSG